MQNNKRLLAPARARCWDWKKRDVDLAVEHGLSRERIRQIRRQAKKRKPKIHRLSRQAIWIMENAELLVGFTRQEISIMAGISYSHMKRHLKKQKISTVRGSECHIWPFVNWNLPNAALDKIWKLPFNTAAVKRNVLQKEPALFTVKNLKGCEEEFCRLVALEKANAKYFFDHEKKWAHYFHLLFANAKRPASEEIKNFLVARSEAFA